MKNKGIEIARKVNDLVFNSDLEELLSSEIKKDSKLNNIELELRIPTVINNNPISDEERVESGLEWLAEDPTCNVECIISQEDGKVYDEENYPPSKVNFLHSTIRYYGNFDLVLNPDDLERPSNTLTLIGYNDDTMEMVEFIANLEIQDFFDFIKTISKKRGQSKIVLNFGKVSDNRHYDTVSLDSLKVNSDDENVRKVEKLFNDIIDKCKYYLMLDDHYPFKFEGLDETEEFLVNSLRLQGDEVLEKYMVKEKRSIADKLV